MAATLHTVSIISTLLAVLFGVIAVIIWFVFKIPYVIGDLSGRNAKKSIEMMRQNNEKTGDKSFKSSGINLARGKLTKTIEGIGQTSNSKETGLLKENGVDKEDFQATELLLSDSTELLGESGETMSLDEKIDVDNRIPSSIKIKIIDEEMIIHTDERLW